MNENSAMEANNLENQRDSESNPEAHPLVATPSPPLKSCDIQDLEKTVENGTNEQAEVPTTKAVRKYAKAVRNKSVGQVETSKPSAGRTTPKNKTVENSHATSQNKKEDDDSKVDQASSSAPSNDDAHIKYVYEVAVENGLLMTRRVKRMIQGTSNASTSSQPTPKKPKLKKKILKDDLKEEDDFKPSWYTLQCLRYELETNGQNLPKDKKKRLEKLLEPIKETGLSSEKSNVVDNNYAEVVETLENISNNIFGNTQNGPAEQGESNDEIPRPLLTSHLKINVETKKGADILRLAADSETNNIYESSTFKLVRGSFKRPPTRFFEEKGFKTREGNAPGEILDIAVFDCNSSPEKLKEQVESQSVSIVRGYQEILNFDKFGADQINMICQEQNITTYRQKPQACTQNLSMTGGDIGWKMKSIPQYATFGEFISNLEHVQDVAAQGFKAYAKASSLQAQKKVLKKMEEDLKKAQMPYRPVNKKDLSKHKSFNYPLITFGSNVDLVDAKEQQDEINLLPEFMRPRKELLEYLDVVLRGINEMQVYFKQPGVRTSAHIENQGIGSINLNCGDGESVWIVVSMKYAAQMEKLMFEKKVWPYSSKFWPNEEDLIEAGISYSKFLQKKGDLVYLNTGAWHWVQSNGFSCHVSWNVMQLNTTQLTAAALIQDHNAEQKWETVLPIAPLLWEVARKKVQAGTNFSKLVKKLLARNLARAKFEVDFAQKKLDEINNNMEEGEEPKEIRPISKCVFAAELPAVNRCQHKNCRQNVLNNLIVFETMKKRTVETKKTVDVGIWCVHHVEDWRYADCFEQDKLDDLAVIFDNYN